MRFWIWFSISHSQLCSMFTRVARNSARISGVMSLLVRTHRSPRDRSIAVSPTGCSAWSTGIMATSRAVVALAAERFLDWAKTTG